MERFQKIVWHEKYKETYERLQQLEIDRKFCGHDIEHFLSVARISYLMILEKRLPVSKDIIYATALLHDLGRADQYEKGISHEEAGAILAEEILTDCGYTREERKFMTDTILRHRDMKEESESFASIFYRADQEIASTAKQDRNVIGRKKRKTTSIYTRRDAMIIGNKTFDTKHHGYIMGILNVTPDSFSDGGKYDHLDAALKHADEMVRDGAAIIDVGGESTRPGYKLISDEEEIARVTPVIEALKKEFDVPVSLDTYKSGVAKAGIEAGADLINDIWGLKWDGTMAAVLAETGVASCLMHNRKDTDYKDYLNDVVADLDETMKMAKEAGIKKETIMLDPGIGFAKDLDQNLELMNHLELLNQWDVPVLLGTSRKSMIGLTLDLPSDQRVEGTVATTVSGYMKGCRFFRVHDVKENMRAMKMIEAICAK